MKKNIIILCTLSIVLLGCGSGGSSGSTETAQSTTTTTKPTTVEPLALPTTIQNTLNDPVSPATAVDEMGIGINLGNTLDAPFEGEWALPAEEYYIQAFKDAGFKHIRIPITWANHVEENAPYTVDTSFMERAEQIVNWALDRDLYVIINMHHDDWIKTGYGDQATRNRFDAIWMQIAAKFKSHSSKLMFEILNEPQVLSLENLNTLNKRVLSIIRNETSNRLVVFSGTEWTNVDKLIEADIPDTNDTFLIANFHNYDPWEFGGQCTRSWGTDSDKDDMTALYQKAKTWSDTHQIPVMVNEFGSAKFDFTAPENVCDQASREAYINAHIDNLKHFGFAGTFWDDGGSFSTYDRAENSWSYEKDILVKD